MKHINKPSLIRESNEFSNEKPIHSPQYEESLSYQSELEKKLEYLSSVMLIMKEDLQIKDEQFDYLYASLRAQTEQTAQQRDYEGNILRGRIHFLESVIQEKDAEKEHLRMLLADANRRLILLSNSGATTCWLSSLPNEIQQRVTSFADDRSLALLSVVSKQFYQVTSIDTLWRDRFVRRWGSKRLIRVTNELKSWKICYSDCHFVDENWVRQKARVRECKGHNGTVTCLALHDDLMVSGSDDGSMFLWDLSRSYKQTTFDCGDDVSLPVLPPPALPLAQLVGSGWSSRQRTGKHSTGAGAELGTPQKERLCSKLKTFHGHGGPVWCLDFDQDSNTLVSGSYDRTLKVWDVATGRCERTLRGHTGWVSSLALVPHSSDRVVSASWDCSIRTWDIEAGTLLHTMFAGVGNALYCVGTSPDGGTVSVGCRNCQIQRYDMTTGMILDSLLGHGKEVYCVQMAQKVLLSGSGDSSVKVWDPETGSCALTLKDHTATVMTLQYDNEHRLVTGSYDKTIKVWDLRNVSSAVSSVTAHQAAIFCLKFDDERLISGSADHTIKVFDFSTASSSITSSSRSLW